MEAISTRTTNTERDEFICTAGVISKVRPLKSRKGDIYAQAVMEDMTGSIEAIVFPDSYRKLQSILKNEIPMLIKAGIRVEEGASPKLIINHAEPLEEAKVPLPTSIRIRIALETATPATIDALHAICRESKGAAKVLFYVERAGDFMAVLETDGEYNIYPDSSFRRRISELSGVTLQVVS